MKHLGSHQLRRGTGPRHLEFSKHQKMVYVCGELDNTVTVLRYNTEMVDTVLSGGYLEDDNTMDSVLTHVQTISSVPEDIDTKSTIAEMRLHPSGR